MQTPRTTGIAAAMTGELTSRLLEGLRGVPEAWRLHTPGRGQRGPPRPVSPGRCEALRSREDRRGETRELLGLDL